MIALFVSWDGLKTEELDWGHHHSAGLLSQLLQEALWFESPWQGEGSREGARTGQWGFEIWEQFSRETWGCDHPC